MFRKYSSILIVMLLMCAAYNVYAQGQGGKAIIYAPRNLQSDVLSELRSNPRAVDAMNKGLLELSATLPDQSKFSIALGAKPNVYMTYPDPKAPGGVGRVNGSDAIKQKLQQLDAERNNPQTPPGQNPQPPQSPPPQSSVICVVPQPGQADEDFTPPTLPNVTYKGGHPYYGNKTDNPGKYILGGPIIDDEPLVLEDPTNFGLRKIKRPDMKETVTQAAEQALAKPSTPGAKQPTAIVILPSKIQADEYLKSDPDKTGGSYTVDGVKVKVGKYNAKQLDPTTGITFDESCKPTQGAIPPNNPFTPPNDPGNPGNPDDGFGGGGGNGGGGDGDGGGGLGGLGALLPLLMQGLLGGGQQGQQGYGQNPYGNQYGQNPYNNQYGQQQQDCRAFIDTPLCGSDGKTYRNACYMDQLGITQSYAGVCRSSATPSTVLNQINSSGIPSELMETIRTIISSVLSSIVSSGSVEETIIR